MLIHFVDLLRQCWNDFIPILFDKKKKCQYNKSMFGFYDSYFLLFGLKITYYGLIIAIGIGLGIFLACVNAKARKFKSDDILIAACYIVPIAIICARIYYVLFDGQKQSFVEIFKIWDGGISIMGAVLGGALGLGLYCVIHKKNFFDLADVVVPSVILGQALGRIGCYFAGCCRGIVVTDPRFTKFPLAVFEGGSWHLATFFYESWWNILVFIALMLLLRVFRMRQRGSVAAAYLVFYGIGRAWIETLRGDSLMIGSMKVSFLVSILMIVAGLAMFITFFVLDRKRGLKLFSMKEPVVSSGEIIVERPVEGKTKKTQKVKTTQKDSTPSKDETKLEIKESEADINEEKKED